jgi:glycosyltransferase involved in cell wall biosynthesis
LKYKVQRHKEYRRQKGYKYNDNPLISFVLLSFNHRENTKKILKALRVTGDHEVIICEDGSIDGSFQEWAKGLDRANDFLIRSNDIHELRAYDRASRMARGKFICLLQDDSIPPYNDLWVEQAIELFNAFPSLVVLGGRAACHYYQASPKTYEPHYRTKSGIPFMFASWTIVEPMFLRKKEFLDAGGINLSYSPPGKNGIEHDVELSLRMWLSGHKVGFYSTSFCRGVGGSGVDLFDPKGRKEQGEKNKETLRKEYITKRDQIHGLVDQANKVLVKK